VIASYFEFAIARNEWGEVEALVKALYAASDVKSEAFFHGGLSGGGGS
jgi:poly(3-hydroxybutyrate) depolymerase